METCLFCLEPTNQATNPLLYINFSKYADVCSCRIYSHFDCWMIYYLKKGHFECPICHIKCDRTENIIVRLRDLRAQIQVPELSFEDGIRQNTLCIVCGCFWYTGIIFVCLFVPIFLYLKR